MVRNRSITETQKTLSIFPSKLLHGVERDPFGAGAAMVTYAPPHKVYILAATLRVGLHVNNAT